MNETGRISIGRERLKTWVGRARYSEPITCSSSRAASLNSFIGSKFPPCLIMSCISAIVLLGMK